MNEARRELWNEALGRRHTVKKRECRLRLLPQPPKAAVLLLMSP